MQIFGLLIWVHLFIFFWKWWITPLEKIIYDCIFLVAKNTNLPLRKKYQVRTEHITLHVAYTVTEESFVHRTLCSLISVNEGRQPLHASYCAIVDPMGHRKTKALLLVAV